MDFCLMNAKDIELKRHQAEAGKFKRKRSSHNNSSAGHNYPVASVVDLFAFYMRVVIHFRLSSLKASKFLK